MWGGKAKGCNELGERDLTSCRITHFCFGLPIVHSHHVVPPVASRRGIVPKLEDRVRRHEDALERIRRAPFVETFRGSGSIPASALEWRGLRGPASTRVVGPWRPPSLVERQRPWRRHPVVALEEHLWNYPDETAEQAVQLSRLDSTHQAPVSTAVQLSAGGGGPATSEHDAGSTCEADVPELPEQNLVPVKIDALLDQRKHKRKQITVETPNKKILVMGVADEDNKLVSFAKEAKAKAISIPGTGGQPINITINNPRSGGDGWCVVLVLLLLLCLAAGVVAFLLLQKPSSDPPPKAATPAAAPPEAQEPPAPPPKDLYSGQMVLDTEADPFGRAAILQRSVGGGSSWQIAYVCGFGVSVVSSCVLVLLVPAEGREAASGSSLCGSADLFIAVL